jgi:hypothetical protein
MSVIYHNQAFVVAKASKIGLSGRRAPASVTGYCLHAISPNAGNFLKALFWTDSKKKGLICTIQCVHSMIGISVPIALITASRMLA